jgi:hypothetical protein
MSSDKRERNKEMKKADQKFDRMFMENHPETIKKNKEIEKEKMTAFHKEACRNKEEQLKKGNSSCAVMKVGGIVNHRRGNRIGSMK